MSNNQLHKGYIVNNFMFMWFESKSIKYT